MDDLTALLRAHMAAAQAWRALLDARQDGPGPLICQAEWEEAERALTRVLEAGHA